MRVIWYFIDSLSPALIPELNPAWFNAKLPAQVRGTVLNELAARGLRISNGYSYGYTQASVTSLLTGTDIAENPGGDAKEVENSFIRIFDETITSQFKKAGFRTAYYGNLNTRGVTWAGKYGWHPRFHSTLYRDFDEVFPGAERSNWTAEEHLGKDRASQLFGLDRSPDEKQFIMLYDYSLHDDSRSYNGATFETYTEAARDSIGYLKRNLEFLRYDPEKDFLVFSSDHGLTLAPYTDVYFNPKIGSEVYEKYWPTVLSEIRMKFCFFIAGPGIEGRTLSTPVHAKDVFPLVQSLSNTRN